MPIDITGLSGSILKPTGEKQVQEQGQDQARQQTPAPAAPSTDSVELTGTAAQLRQLEATVRNLPVVDAQRVESVRDDLHSGQFVVDPARVADKMISFEGMLNKR